MKYIAYYRTSTKEQNLGIEAQKIAVRSYNIVAEYEEQESGKNNNRKQLQAAIKHCKEINATLLIAKLDRLSRNLTFISSLMDSKVLFKCADMPEADNFSIHIFAALAQKERELISDRTKRALNVLKSQGIKLGSKSPEKSLISVESRNKSIETRKQQAKLNQNTLLAKDLIDSKLNEGKTLVYIADLLNKRGHRTPKGKEFTCTQVRRISMMNI